MSTLVFTIVIHADEIEGMEMSWKIPETFVYQKRFASKNQDRDMMPGCKMSNRIDIYIGGKKGTYPRSVRMMFMRKSGPQPAIISTATGGTVTKSVILP